MFINIFLGFPFFPPSLQQVIDEIKIELKRRKEREKRIEIYSYRES